MIRYVNKCDGTYKTYLKSEDGKERKTALLWGDPVLIMQDLGNRVKVRARRQEGYVEAAALCDESLLELYVIDVGQGDAVLFKTPRRQVAFHSNLW